MKKKPRKYASHKPAPAMTAAEFEAWFQQTGKSREDVAAIFKRNVRTLDAWRMGRLPVQGYVKEIIDAKKM